MSSAAVLNIDELTLPISDASPSGEPLADAIRLQLDELRKEADDFDASSAGRQADWPKILRLATETLSSKSKDLLLAVRLVEAATKKHGAAGLRDSLQLLGRLVADCWDYLHPMPGPGEDAEVRAGPFHWLNDSMRGAKFPQAIRSIPLLKAGSRTFAYVDWITPERKGDLEEVIGKIDTPALRTAFADVTAAWSALEVLSRALDERLGNDAAPNFLSPENTSSIGTAIEQCLQLIREIAHRRGVELEPSANGAAEPEAGDASLAPSSPTAASTAHGNSREELYRQIEVIATTLKRIEPHSPIPFMLERCVRLGGLPFPSLMRAIIRETGTLDELDRIMGIEAPAED